MTGNHGKESCQIWGENHGKDELVLWGECGMEVQGECGMEVWCSIKAFLPEGGFLRYTCKAVKS